MKLRYNHYLCLLLGAMAIASCSDDTSDALSWEIGDGTKIDYPEDYFTGGQLGTTPNNSSPPTSSLPWLWRTRVW